MRKSTLAIAGAAAGAAAGLVAQRVALRRKRGADPDAREPFGGRRGTRSRTIQLPDGAAIFVEEVGPEEATKGAIFVHGSVLRTDAWYYQLAGLNGHRLVFYDLRGHGLSQPKGDSKYTIETLASDFHAVIEDAGLQEVVIVGHSVGGMIALQLCKQRPELVGSTIVGLGLVNTTHRPAVETIFGGAAVVRLERLARRPLDFVGKRTQTIDQLRKVVRPSDAIFWGVAFAAFGPGASARQVDFTYDMLAETPSDVIFDLIKCYRDFEVTENLADIDIPALVFTGTHDKLCVPEASEYLAEHLPRSELVTFDGCGHMTMLERHSEFGGILARFLDDTLGPAEQWAKRKARA